MDAFGLLDSSFCFRPLLHSHIAQLASGGNGNPSPAPCRGGGALRAGVCNRVVMSGEGPTAVTLKKVPCPLTGNM